MSHITKVNGFIIRDLDVLERALDVLGFELLRDVNRGYRSYYGESEVGNCRHVARFKGTADGYEVGVIQTGDGYRIEYDRWGVGGAITKALGGKQLDRLRDNYGALLAEQMYQADGYQTAITTDADGSLTLSAWQY